MSPAIPNIPPANSIVVPFAWKNTIAIITQISTASPAKSVKGLYSRNSVPIVFKTLMSFESVFSLDTLPSGRSLYVTGISSIRKFLSSAWIVISVSISNSFDKTGNVFTKSLLNVHQASDNSVAAVVKEPFNRNDQKIHKINHRPCGKKNQPCK